ncbi:DDE-domain-containing protein [Patellaria atrata CBS 101060]|uniref:DDE-domain-containing protein n=1 Tax=Patellaria atrata CBS 101060 TaxID=1346257 RepID=A0A9P4S2X4_9PEZI|nr:DDE-domain-containing protein [Patellaria atrata CBS 101060]
MAPIDEALAALRISDDPNITRITKEYGVNCTTLSRRLGIKHSLGIPLLVNYINDVSIRGLAPTPAMLLSLSWPSRWIQGNLGALKSAYLTPIDVVRKSAEYFSKAAWESRRLKHVIQDGSREWITLVATIYADGTALPPALIYEAVSGDLLGPILQHLQDTWFQDYKPLVDEYSFASSPTGWTNNQLGMEWLTNVFEPQTKAKARNGRDWRLLLVDGHGSHLTLPFINYCINHRIILANFPAHSTHRL